MERKVKFWDLEPGNDLLTGRAENEAYLTCTPGKAYVVFFTDGGEVGLDLRQHPGTYRLTWANIRTGEWTREMRIKGGEIIRLLPPGSQEWTAIILKN